MTISNSKCILEIKTDSLPIRIWESNKAKGEYYEELYDLVDEGYEFKYANKLNRRQVIQYLYSLKELVSRPYYLQPMTCTKSDCPTGEGMFSFYLHTDGEKQWFKRVFFLDTDTDKNLIKLDALINDLENQA